MHHAGGGMLTVNGVRLYHEQRGSGVPILCVHGTGSSAVAWEAALPALAGVGRVIAYDRRGHTRSERREPMPPTRVARHTDDAAALLGALDAAPAVVIGRSYGGQVAIDLALRHPDSVRALVLLEGVPESLDPEADRWIRDLVARTLAAGERTPAAAAETLFGEVLGARAWADLPDEVRGMFLDNGPAVIADLSGDDFLDVDAADLARIDKPTLLVAATGSPPAFMRAHEKAVAAMPAARGVLVGGGHMIDPADPAVLAFIREVGG